MQNTTPCHHLEQIFALIDEKISIDRKSTWSHGSSTYFSEIHKELDEVAQELKKGRRVYLEDELGDVLWDYLNLLKNLDMEDRINMTKVFERCCKKYTERLTHDQWHIIKKRQKARLQEEQERVSRGTLTKNEKFSSMND
jgi:NTP pyrophosphatase (non-canonical NTP hydrolase)